MKDEYETCWLVKGLSVWRLWEKRGVGGVGDERHMADTQIGEHVYDPIVWSLLGFRSDGYGMHDMNDFC